MEEIKRDLYLNRLISRRNSDLIKVITGMRRCGKSYLLFKLYYNYLLSIGIDEKHIITINLEDDKYEDLYDKVKLREYIKSKIIDNKQYYLFLDEIQTIKDFERMLNGLNQIENLDIYVTGSNSKFLSTDIITEFRGRTEEIKVYPLSFSEFYNYYDSKNNDSLTEYLLYGGMPYTLSFDTPEEKSKYLKDLFKETFIRDIIDRYKIQKNEVLDTLTNILASSVGSLTNPNRITGTFVSKGYKEISNKTIEKYINCLLESFIISKAQRYNIKGRKYISVISKYYFNDLGLRNALLNFRQFEETHLMENAIYNELIYRGYNVDVGVVEVFKKDEDGKTIRVNYEIDFVCNKSYKRYYIQSALTLDDEDKKERELRPYLNIYDNFTKIIVTKNSPTYRNEDGVLIIGLKDFLLNQNIFDKII